MPKNLPKRLSELKEEPKKKVPRKPPKEKNVSQPEQSTPSAHPVITRIQAQKRKGRYNIYLNDEYAFAVDEALLIKYLLRKDMEISPELQKQLETEDVSRKAYQRALVYLSYALRSEKQVREDLIEHEFEEQADEVIDLLKEQRLINDLMYAKSYVRTAYTINRKGPQLIQRELVKKGISPEEILDALEEYPHEEQVDNAFKLGEKMVAKSTKRSSRETQTKVRQHLMQKGFNSDIIEEVLRELDTQKDESEEMDALRKQGEKAWRRYSKFEAAERRQKTKANLYQKGFNGELIQAFIEEKEMEEENE
ncbi:recombination regulator RecX [Atopococcus tabaci]|uniref:recombination regulator RecX n=1 Tax=Atopococcus tabaci TaxID=269774 RepID=UPI00240A9764|nr:recombination regulator RecX [Atopococcus tabaci]